MSTDDDKAQQEQESANNNGKREREEPEPQGEVKEPISKSAKNSSSTDENDAKPPATTNETETSTTADSSTAAAKEDTTAGYVIDREGTSAEAIAPVAPTPAPADDPNAWIEERDEVPAQFVGKVIGKVRIDICVSILAYSSHSSILTIRYFIFIRAAK